MSDEDWKGAIAGATHWTRSCLNVYVLVYLFTRASNTGSGKTDRQARVWVPHLRPTLPPLRLHSVPRPLQRMLVLP